MDHTLRVIADNENLFKALQKHLEDKFDVTTIALAETSGLSDEVLGQKVRAQILGLNALREGFAEIARLKSRPESKPMSNPAR